MKKVSIIILLMFIILLSGCVSDSEYKDLEERVSNLEKQLELKNGTTDSGENRGESESDSKASLDEETDDSNGEDSYTYLIDSLSDADVVNECNYYFLNIPLQGESYDEYYAKLKAMPIRTSENDGVDCGFYDYTKRIEQTDHDVVTRIGIIGTQTEMDGTIGYSNNYYGVQISMLIQNYERASNIYAQLFDIISAKEKYTELRDTRDSTRWSAYGMFWTSDYGAMGVELMSMEKLDEGYYLTATYYSRRE